MAMTEREKRQAYYKAAKRAIEYAYNCADMNIVPLKHDANLMFAELERIKQEAVR